MIYPVDSAIRPSNNRAWFEKKPPLKLNFMISRVISAGNFIRWSFSRVYVHLHWVSLLRSKLWLPGHALYLAQFLGQTAHSQTLVIPCPPERHDLFYRNWNRKANWLIDWLIDWLTNWLIDWLVDWLTDWLVDWLIDRSIDRLTNWLTDWLTDWLIGWLTDWLTDWLLLTHKCNPPPSSWLSKASNHCHRDMENTEASVCCRDHVSGNEKGAKVRAASIKLLKTDV